MNEHKEISVTSIMTPAPLETANRTDNVDTIIRIMTVKHKSSVVIINELKHPEGIITERDIVRRLVFESKDAKLTKAADIMSSPLITLNDDSHIYDAAMIMSKHSIRRLPIVKDNVLLGIVTATDLVRALYQENRKDGSLHAVARGSLPRNKKFFIWNFMEEYDISMKKHAVMFLRLCLRYKISSQPNYPSSYKVNLSYFKHLKNMNKTRDS